MNGELSFAARRRRLRRGWGGLAALSYPVGLILLSLAVGWRRGGDVADIATSFLAALLFLVAAPTAWIFAFEFIDVSRFTILFVGTATSLPLWYLVGSRLADASQTWWSWMRRYVLLALAWTAFTIFLVATVAQLA